MLINDSTCDVINDLYITFFGSQQDIKNQNIVQNELAVLIK